MDPERSPQLSLDDVVDLSEVDAWIAEFPVVKLKSALTELKRRRGEIDAMIADVEARLVLFEQLAGGRISQPNGVVHTVGGAGVVGAGASGVAVTTDAAGRIPKRAAILKVMQNEPGREFKVRDVRGYLITMGVITDSEADAHALQVMMASMHNRGEIERTRPGYYKFLSPSSEAFRNEEPATTGVQSP